MLPSRRDFLKAVVTGFASVAFTGEPPSPTNPAAVSDPLFGDFKGIGSLNTIEETAFSFAELASTSGVSAKEWVQVGQDLGIKANGLSSFVQWRKFLKKSPPEFVEKVIANKDEAIRWMEQMPAYSESPKVMDRIKKGAETAERLYRMADKEFETFCKQHVDDIRTEYQKSEQEDQKKTQSAKTQLVHDYLAQHKELKITWDTIKHATTKRIKITVVRTHHPEAILSALDAKLREAFPKDDVALNRVENRIYIRNPSHAIIHTLKPYLLQKGQEWSAATSV